MGRIMVRFLITLWMSLLLAACATPHAVDQRHARITDAPYLLDSGDELRVVVFDQADLTNTYSVDANGRISVPLIGPLRARGRTIEEVENAITAALRDGYLRDPSVSVQVETYRPFFILGEVGSPGQYPYVAGLTAETAVAIAGGFTPRAVKSYVSLTRRVRGRTVEVRVPSDYPVAPGDTVKVPERWF